MQISLLGKAFNAWRGQPRVWLWLSLAGLPLMFSRNYFIKGTGTFPTLDTALSLTAELLCFMAFFLFWCLAVLAYDLDEWTASSDLVILWRETISRERGYFLRLAGRFWLYELLYRMACMLPFIVVMIFAFYRSDFHSSMYEMTFMVVVFIADSLSALLIVRICLSPQVAMLVGGSEKKGAKATMQASIEVVKQDYRRVLLMFLPPWVLGGALITGLLLVYDHFAKGGLLALVFLLAAACIEGGRISFIAAGFNEYFKENYR